MTIDFTTPIGTVRRYIGDTDETSLLVSDDEITAWLEENAGNEKISAVRILRSLAAKYGRKGKVTTGNESLDFTTASQAFTAAADALEKEMATKATLKNTTVRRESDADRYRRYPYGRRYPPIGLP